MNGSDLTQLEMVNEICKTYGWSLRSGSMDQLIVIDAPPDEQGKMIVRAETLENIHFFLLGYEHADM